MRFPSISALTRRAGEVLRRFPLTLLLGAVAAACAAAAVDGSGDDLPWRIALVAVLGLPLSIGLALLSRYRTWSSARQFVWQLAGLIVLALFFWSWPGPEQKPDMIRYLQLAAILHLAVSVLPFIRGQETTAYWQYNRRLFESFLRAAVFAAVLFVGLAVALGALDKLFGVPVPDRTYLRLWLVMAFLVHPWIFLAGAPDEAQELAFNTYPRALKLFTQYVLTPLVAIYLIILVLYLGKIIVTGQWPDGWIGYLVTSVAIAGMLGFLLVHPLRTLPDESWIRLYARGLFIGLIPAAIMLLLALWKRVEPYGLTPLRLLGLVLGIWLLGIAVLYTLSRNTSIRTIPLSLAAVLAACFAGPLGIRNLSVDSQRDRLAQLLSQKTPSELRSREASAALGFLLEYNAAGEVRHIFGDSALRGVELAKASWSSRDSTARRLLAMRGVSFSPEGFRPSRAFEPATREGGGALAVAGYEWMLPVTAGHDTATVHMGGELLHLRTDSTRRWLTVERAGSVPVVFAIDSMFRASRAAADAAGRAAALTAVQLDGKVRFLLALDHIYGFVDSDSLRINGWGGQLFLGTSPP